jgi:hypothetical protein
MDALVAKALMIRLSLRDIRLQQYPRFQQPSGRALSLPNQRLEPFAFLAAQPRTYFFTEISFTADCLCRPDGDQSESPSFQIG